MGEKVCVGCLVPNGLWLRIFEDEPEMVRVQHAASPSGYIIERKPREILPRVRLNGGRVKLPPGSPHQKVGFGLTLVDRDWFAKWMRQTGEKSDWIRDGIIFVAKNGNRARAEAREKQGSITSGFEPIDTETVVLKKNRFDEKIFGMRDPRAQDITRGVPLTITTGEN